MIVIILCILLSIAITVIAYLMKQQNSLKRQLNENINTKTNSITEENSDTVIKYILNQAQKNTIKMGKKNNDVYICFADTELSNFLRDWFVVLKVFQTGDMKSEMYEMFLETYKSKRD